MGRLLLLSECMMSVGYEYVKNCKNTVMVHLRTLRSLNVSQSEAAACRVERRRQPLPKTCSESWVR
jgi:hypothetical protein